eukprot:8789410-Pyramimonas_sp.AAC.1
MCDRGARVQGLDHDKAHRGKTRRCRCSSFVAAVGFASECWSERARWGGLGSRGIGAFPPPTPK